jgi:hypothetical protein
MSSSPQAANIFGKAIQEHLKVVRQVQEQQGVLEVIALAMAAILRAGGGKISEVADHLFAVASRDTARVHQEAHILAGHMLCDWIELDRVHPLATAQETAVAVQAGGAR